MTFIVKIEAPGAGSAEAAIAKVETGLAKTTAAADKTRDAMGRVVGTSADLAKLSAAAEKAAAATKHLAAEGDAGTGVSAKLKRAHDDVIGTLAREADIIERLRGPMREYRADMDALESLYKRNKISAAEYDDELQRLIKTQGTMHGPVHEQTQDKDVGLGDLAKAAAGGDIAGAIPGAGAVLGAVAAIHSLFEAYHALKDKYIEITNTALKFVDASHSVDVVIDEQLAVSAKLHTSLATTLDLYDAVRDGTDGLNVSHAEQIRLLEVMGEAFILAGKGAENAGGLMQKFSYALASGKIESRELRGIMREVPEIADAWTTHFGLTRVEIVKAVTAGKIGVEDLMQAMIAEGKTLDDNYGKRRRTHEQLVAERDQRLEIAKQRSEESGDGSYTPSGDRFGFQQRQRDQVAKEYDDKARIVALEGKRVEMAKLLGGELEKNARVAAVAAAAQGAGVAFPEFDLDKANAISKVTLLMKEFGVTVSSEFNEATTKEQLFRAELDKINESKAAEKLAEDLHKVWRELNNVNDVLVVQKKHWDDLADHAGQLKQAVANSPGAQLLARGIGPIPGIAITRDDIENVRALRAATLELDTASNQYGKTIVEAKTRTNEHRDAVTDLKGAYAAHAITLKEYTDGLKAAGVEESAAAKLLHELNEPAKQYEIRLGALNVLLSQGAINTALYNSEVKKLQGTLTDFMPDPDSSKLAAKARARAQADYEHDEHIKQLMRDATKEYSRPDDPNLAADTEQAKQLEEARKKMASKTFTGAWKEMNADAKTFAATMAGEVNSSLDKLNDNLITAAQGGEVAWGKMAESILADLERILLKQLEIAAITALLNYVAAGAGTAAASSGATGAAVGAANSNRIGAGSYPGAYPSGAAVGGGAASVGNSARSSGAAPVFVNHIHNHYDRSVAVAAIQSREGATATLNMMRANGGAVRR